MGVRGAAGRLVDNWEHVTAGAGTGARGIRAMVVAVRFTWGGSHRRCTALILALTLILNAARGSFRLLVLSQQPVRLLVAPGQDMQRDCLALGPTRVNITPRLCDDTHWGNGTAAANR